MEDYKILTGKDLTLQMYQRTWELDNEYFPVSSLISESLSKSFYRGSNQSTIVLYDPSNDKVIGYLSPFLMNQRFFENYINNEKSFKKIRPRDFHDRQKDGKEANIYIFSTLILPEYRDRVLTKDKSSKFYNKKAFQVLNEAMVDWICEIKKYVSINYVFAEKVTDEGEKYLKSMKMEPCFSLGNDAKYASLFSPSMFSKCSNVSKLYEIYDNEKIRYKYKKEYFNTHEFLSIKKSSLYFKDINLEKLAQKYGTPLEVSYLPIIEEKVNFMKNLFKEKIKKYNYGGKYYYAYATKANYYSETVVTVKKYCDILETSSAYDIDIILELMKLGVVKKGQIILCNGFKSDKYIEAIGKLVDMGVNVIPIIENNFEFEKLCKLNKKINVGVRYNSDFEARLIKNNFKDYEEFDNRFGFDKVQMEKICKKIADSKTLKLQLFHFHFGGTITNIDNYIKGYANIFDFYCDLKKKYRTLTYFDFGGGMPVKYSLTYNFNYELLVDQMIKTTCTLCERNGVKAPDLIGEHGRFTVADSAFMIYKVDFVKKLNGKYWYIINTSLMNMTPDMWGIGQDFTILPINHLNRTTIPVVLGGETCDPDDRYFLNDKNVTLFMPKIEEGEDLYVGIFSTGAYQDIISGIGGVHHCLIPEGKEVIIYKKEDKNVFYEVSEKQSTDAILKVLDYTNKNHIKRFTAK